MQDVIAVLSLPVLAQIPLLMTPASVSESGGGGSRSRWRVVLLAGVGAVVWLTGPWRS